MHVVIQNQAQFCDNRLAKQAMGAGRVPAAGSG